MGLIDDASELFDIGMSKAKGAVSNVALEQLGFVRAFCRLCEEGWQLGYHECNGGNVSYRLSADDISAASTFFYTNPSSWVALEEAVPSMANQYLLVTAAGSYLKNVSTAPGASAGIVQINETGSSWRIVWGFRNNGRPTSEISAHVAAQGVRMEVTEGASHVIYHAHPTSIATLTAILPIDTRTLTNVLWKCLTESVIAFPQGVGALSWMVPGSKELASATALQLKHYPACIWELHGVLCSGATPDAALGMVHAIDKAATAHIQARAAVHGNTKKIKTLSNDDLRAIAAAYGLPLNEELLEESEEPFLL